MCDMGGLDNLIANTAYLQARKSVDGDIKQMQKRRKSLSLPSQHQCIDFRQKISADYESVCEQQPIGKALFHKFTESIPEYQVAVDFLNEVNNIELAENRARANLQNVMINFLKADSKNYLSFLSQELATKCKSAEDKDFEELLIIVKSEVRKFLMGTPFQDFQNSPFFDKFIQWKVFERQPITEKYFYEFRVLGKGGFGEVCAIQVKISGKMYACKKLDKKRLKKKNGEKMALLEKGILEKTNRTNGYMAPEILNEETYTYSVDWFALGCSIYEMIAGRTPFKDFKEKVSIDKVKRRTLEDEVAYLHNNFTDESKDICKLFLAKKVEDRLGCNEEYGDPRKHPFFKSINFQRLEAGLIESPFVPNPATVYCKDLGDIADFSEVRGVDINEKDKKFYKKFATGSVSIPWQDEMIESGLFEELSDPARRESKAGYSANDEAKSGVCTIL